MKLPSRPWIIMFVLFLLGQSFYLHRVPGLLGDEGSEGENAYQLLQSDHITVVGERSYIGPWIDYVRVPFIAVFGYTTLGIRVPMLIASSILFLLAAAVLRRAFHEEAALWGTALLTFSPVYMAYQRLGWVITLLPLVALLIVWLAQKRLPLLAGLAAGVGLATHIMFLPTLVAVIAIGLLYQAKQKFRNFFSWWPCVVSFWAGFGMQFAVLLLLKDDQGDPGAVAQLFSERLAGLKGLLPLLVSGSSYVAAYTGEGFSIPLMWAITALIFILALAAFLLPKRKLTVLALWVGLIVQVLVLLSMIDRYTLRYFVVPVLWLWMLAGVGAAALVAKLPSRAIQWSAVAGAGGLSTWMIVVLFIPFLRTGGSTGDVPLSNRTESAAALVDVRPLTACLAGKGPVFSENVHILNRLTYLARSNEQLKILPEEEKNQAEYLVHYRLGKDKKTSRDGEVCPALEHFKVLSR